MWEMYLATIKCSASVSRALNMGVGPKGPTCSRQMMGLMLQKVRS